MEQIMVRSNKRMEMVDITPLLEKALAGMSLKRGALVLCVPHTTAAITVNEGADPAVCRDILENLSRLVPHSARYHHREGNSDSHILASLVGSSQLLLVEEGKLCLGTWQRVFLCEFDGPRTRSVWLQALGSSTGSVASA